MQSFYRPHKRVQARNELIDPHTGVVTEPPSMTKQEFQKECDINNIIKAYSTSGMLKHVSANAALGSYEDLPDSVDFQESLAQVEQARQAFMTLPSRLRDRFQQDPVQFLDYVSNPANKAEMAELGLLLPQPPSTSQTNNYTNNHTNNESSSINSTNSPSGEAAPSKAQT